MQTQTPALPKKELRYDDKVIKKIAGIAAEQVPGVLTVSGGVLGRLRSNEDWTRGIEAEVGRRQVALDMCVVAEYGYNVPQLFDAVAASVTKAMADMTGLQVVELNMQVSDVLNKPDFEQLQEKQHSFDAPRYQGYMPQAQPQANAVPMQ